MASAHLVENLHLMGLSGADSLVEELEKAAQDPSAAKLIHFLAENLNFSHLPNSQSKEEQYRPSEEQRQVAEEFERRLSLRGRPDDRFCSQEIVEIVPADKSENVPGLDEARASLQAETRLVTPELFEAMIDRAQWAGWAID